MEENNQICDCDGNYVPKDTENSKVKPNENSPAPKPTTKRRKLYKTSGNR